MKDNSFIDPIRFFFSLQKSILCIGFLYPSNQRFCIGIKAKNTPEVSTQEHWVYGSFLRDKYTLEAIKMGQICPSVKDTNSQPVSWPKISLNIFGQLIGWLLMSLTEGHIRPIFIAFSIYLSLEKLPYTHCSWMEASRVFLAFIPSF